MDLIDLSLIDIRLGLKQRGFSCLEYVDALLAQAVRWQHLNCFILQDADRLRQDARHFDQTPRDSLLAGIPLIFKDNIDIAGLPTTAGTGRLRNHIALTDSGIAKHLFKAGALLAGKANMHELALGITNNNGVFGASRNPYAPTCIPGGSSGGCGAAIAARLAPGAIGTDTGGSVRLPAALCGVVGLRPSAHRYSQKGIAPISHTRDTAGPMARTVRDVALLDAALCGKENAVELSPPLPRNLRLGVLRDPCWLNLDPDVAVVCEQALTKLGDAGIILVDVVIDQLEPLCNQIGFPVALYEFVRGLPAYLQMGGSTLTLTDLVDGIGSPDVAEIVNGLLEQEITDAAYQQALVLRLKLQKAYQNCFRTHKLDALIFPTSPLPAQPIGHDTTIILNGVCVPVFTTFIRNTEPASDAGIPGISIPAGLTSSGMPVGLELDGQYNEDQALLNVAATVEMILGSIPKPF